MSLKLKGVHPIIFVLNIFSQSSFDYVYISESNENWEKIFDTKMIG